MITSMRPLRLDNDFELFDFLKPLPDDLLHGLGREEDPADLSEIVGSAHHLSDLVSKSFRTGQDSFPLIEQDLSY